MISRAISNREVQIPIRDIIIREFESKSHQIQRLYAIVSLLQSYGLMPYRSLITKSCGMDFETVSGLLESGPLRGVLSFDKEEESILANHRIVADLIREFVFPTNDLIVNGLKKLISVVSEGNIPEMTVIHKLLIDSREFKRQLDFRQKEDLFSLALSRMKTRPLYIHLARTQLRLKKYGDCRISIEDAERTNHPVFPEPLHHVFDVKGRLELSIAREMIAKKNEIVAWDHLEKAEGSFIQGRVNPIITPHPYYGLAQTYFEMARLLDERTPKQNSFILSLNMLGELKRNSTEEFALDSAFELEKRLFQDIARMGFDERDAAMLFERNQNANGYAFLAEKAA